MYMRPRGPEAPNVTLYFIVNLLYFKVCIYFKYVIFYLEIKKKITHLKLSRSNLEFIFHVNKPSLNRFLGLAYNRAGPKYLSILN